MILYLHPLSHLSGKGSPASASILLTKQEDCCFHVTASCKTQLILIVKSRQEIYQKELKRAGTTIMLEANIFKSVDFDHISKRTLFLLHLTDLS